MENNIVAGAVIIGVVNAIQMTFPNVKGFYAFLIALGLGIVLGYLNYFGLTIETGIITALASSGVYKVAQKAGGH